MHFQIFKFVVQFSQLQWNGGAGEKWVQSSTTQLNSTELRYTPCQLSLRHPIITFDESSQNDTHLSVIKKSSYPFRNFDRRKRGTSQKQRRIIMIPVVLTFIPRKLKSIVTIVVQKRHRLEERYVVRLAHRNVIYSSNHCKVIGVTSQLMTRNGFLKYFIM